MILNEIPTDLILSLGSIEDANQYLFENGYTSAKGLGLWLTTITCNNAPSIIPELISNIDEGNDWFLNVDYQYYSATVTEL